MMKALRPLALLIMILTIVSFALGGPLSAPRGEASAPPGYVIDIEPGRIAVTMRIALNQNITGFLPAFKLPITHFLLAGDNASLARSTFQLGLLNRGQSLPISNFQVGLDSSDFIGYNEGQWFNVTVSFTLNGPPQSQGVLNVDLGWKDFVVGLGVYSQSVEVNRVGESYLVNPFQNLVQRQKELQGNPSRSIAFRIDNLPSSGAEVLGAAANFTLFDFSKLSTPVETWSRGFDSQTKGTVWSNAVSSDITAIATVLEQTIETLTYRVGVRLNTQVRVAGIGEAKGNIIRVDSGFSFYTGVMIFSIVAPTMVLAGSSLILRRIGEPRRFKKKDKGRRTVSV